MKIFIPILSLAAFLYLSYTAYQHKPLTMEQLITRSLAEERQHQAEALKDVWQLTDEDITRPVVLW